MAIDYTWRITGLKKNGDGTVVQTYWIKEGTDEHGHKGSFAGATPFTADPSDAGYIAFDDLTEADVIGWIQDIVVGDYEEHVNAQIQKQIDAIHVVDAAVPWGTSEAAPSA